MARWVIETFDKERGAWRVWGDNQGVAREYHDERLRICHRLWPGKNFRSAQIRDKEETDGPEENIADW